MIAKLDNNKSNAKLPSQQGETWRAWSVVEVILGRRLRIGLYSKNASGPNWTDYLFAI